MTDLLNRQFGPISEDTFGALRASVGMIQHGTRQFNQAISGDAGIQSPLVPTIAGFNPDPDSPSRYYYEVEVQFSTEQGIDKILVTIRSDGALTPEEVAAAAEQEAADRLAQSPEGFGYTPDDVDVIAFQFTTVMGIWKTF